MKTASANVPNSTDSCLRQAQIPGGANVVSIESRRHSQSCLSRKGCANTAVSLHRVAEPREDVGPEENDVGGDGDFAKPHDDRQMRDAVIAGLAAEYANWIVHQRKIRRFARECRASVGNHSIAKREIR
jgi:hypothetical protein